MDVAARQGLPSLAPSSKVLVESVCTLAEQAFPGVWATVMLLDDKGVLRFFAAPSLPEAVRTRTDGVLPASGHGSCAHVVLENQAIRVGDARSDSRWQALRHLVDDLQLRACWSTPLRDPLGQVIGTFALTSQTTGIPDPAQESLLESLATLVSQALFRDSADRREKAFATALRSLSDGVLLTDAQQSILYFNAAFAQTTGYSLQDLLGENCRILQGPGTNLATVQRLGQCLEQGKEFRGEMLNYRKDGSSFWNDLTITPVRDTEGTITHYVSIQRDITEAREQAEALRVAAQVFESQEGIMITDPERRIIRVNGAFTRTTGYESEEIVGLTPSVLHSGMHDASFYRQMWEALAAKGVWQGEVWNRRKNGDVYPELLRISAVYDEHQQVTNYIGHFFDVSRQKARETALEHLAHHDPLTDLLNRRALEETLPQARERADRSEQLLAVVVLDLDDFKPINDRLGHEAGDRVLIRLATRLRETLRHSDSVARIGGDEFVLLIEGLRDVDDLESVLEKVVQRVTQPIAMEEGEILQVSVSLGVSIYPFSPHQNLELLLREADRAMYSAKEHKEDRDRAWAYWSLDQEDIRSYPLRHLFRQGGLRAWYQPIWDQRENRLAGIEALARLEDEQGRIWAPDTFLPQLSDQDLYRLTQQMLYRAVADLQTLDPQGSLWVAINIDPRLIGSHCLNCFQGLLDDTGISPQRIFLEILESDDFLDRQVALGHLLNLRAMGFRLALDDVGSGYSSLLRLKELPVEKAKLDQSFIRSLEEQPQDLRFVQAVLELTRRLDVDLVAEGVETDAILDAVTVMGVRYVQGYQIARPMPLHALQEYLSVRQVDGGVLRPSSFLGLYAQHLTHFHILEQALEQNPTLVDFQRLASPDLCPVAQRLRALGVEDDGMLMRLHHEYHDTIGALDAGAAGSPAWRDVEASHHRLMAAFLDAFREQRQDREAQP